MDMAPPAEVRFTLVSPVKLEVPNATPPEDADAVSAYPFGKPVVASVEVEPAKVIAPPEVEMLVLLASLIQPSSFELFSDPERDQIVARPPPVVTDDEDASSIVLVPLISTPFALAVA